MQGDTWCTSNSNSDSNNNATADAFIVQNNAIKAGTELFRVQENGVVTASSDFRAPIFYDSDNTAYYVNAASTSSLNILNLADYVDVGTYIYLRNNLRMLNSGAN